MKKSIAFLTAICIGLSCFAQTLKTISWEDTTRQYLEYVPETYDASTPTPVVFIFHGLGGNMYEVLYNADFNRIAAEQGWITVTPQALPDTFTAMDTTITMNAWHSGVSAVVDGDTIVASEGRDDTGLMMAILDSLIAHYNIDQSNVFCTGVSMGGFMSHRMAIEHGDRIKAIAPVCGTIGNEITSYTPVGHVSVMHLHGTADSIVTYDSGSFQYIVNVNVGLGVDSTIAFWRRYNQCSDTAIHTIFPDICDDGRLFEKFYYGDGTFGTKTVLIKVNGGEHEWCHGPYRDVDFTDEIYNFFASCLGNVPTVSTTATDIAATTATFSGEVTAEGSAAVTARGVCWSNTPHPTIANLHTTDSLGLGAFTSIIPDLTPNTTYYARAYATNEVGTAYSDEICFTTLCDYSALNDTVEITLCENELPYHYVNGDIDTIFEVGTPTSQLLTFNFQLLTSHGCDSTVTLHLTIHPAVTELVEVTLCENDLPYHYVNGEIDTIFEVGTPTSQLLTFNFQLLTQHGCDSTVTLHLTIHPAVTELVEVTLCENDLPYHYVNGEIDTIFEVGTPTSQLLTFNFQLLTQHGCDSVVTLTLTITTGVNEWGNGHFTLYPNPTTGMVNVQWTMNNVQLGAGEIQVLDVYGRLLQNVETCHGASLQAVQIDLSRYATGIYLVRLVNGGKVVAVRKVVREDD